MMMMMMMMMIMMMMKIYSLCDDLQWEQITKKSTIKKMNKKSYRMLVRRASQKGPEAYY